MLDFSFYEDGLKLQCKYEFDVEGYSSANPLVFIRSKNFYCSDECTAHKVVIMFNRDKGNYHPGYYSNFKLKRITKL